MSKVLFLSMPSHGHMNSSLGLAEVLVSKGEEIIFFSAGEFKKEVEEIGAEFKCYRHDLNIFQKKKDTGLAATFLNPGMYIDDLLEDISDLRFDYLIFSAAYPYASTIAKILNIPSVSSFAVFVTLQELFKGNKPQVSDPASKPPQGMMGMKPEVVSDFKLVRQKLVAKYQVEIPENMFDLFFNKGDLNIIYTSEYFIQNLENYDDSFIFIGPPVYRKQYHLAFPFEKLEGKRVIYISMGTIFSNHSVALNNLFFKSFGGKDVVVVMAAYQVDVSQYEIPDNFIIRNYVPQLELLKYISVAITHAGMNSIGDLLYHNVPFVSIPLGADQFYMANRSAELGATIVLDAHNLSAETLVAAVEKVVEEPSYVENIKRISSSFMKAGGYEKAAQEIFKLKASAVPKS